MISGFTTLLLIVAIAGCMFFTLQSLSKGYVSVGGFSVFRVVTGSMEPTIAKGAMIISKKQNISTIKTNDIICFRTNDKTLGHATITHRVINVFTNPDGSVMLQTKGDANPTADASFVSEKQLIGRVIKYTGDDSKMSEIIRFLTGDFGFIACILLPVIIIAAWIFKDAVKSMKSAIDDMKSQLEKTPKSTISDEEYQDIYKKIQNEVRKELEQDVLQNKNCDAKSNCCNAVGGEDSSENNKDCGCENCAEDYQPVSTSENA